MKQKIIIEFISLMLSVEPEDLNVDSQLYPNSIKKNPIISKYIEY